MGSALDFFGVLQKSDIGDFKFPILWIMYGLLTRVVQRPEW